MFADDILNDTEKKLRDFIVYESENIYSINSSAATDTTGIDQMSVEELAEMARKLEETYYKVLRGQKY